MAPCPAPAQRSGGPRVNAARVRFLPGPLGRTSLRGYSAGHGGSEIRQQSRTFSIRSRGRGLYDFTDEVVAWVRSTGIREGLLTLHVRHTSASLVVQENASPDVRGDLERFFARLVPDGDPLFRHTLEGPDDMPAHVRSALTSTTLSIPVADGRPALGTWQGIYLYEHRADPHRRTVAAHVLGE